MIKYHPTGELLEQYADGLLPGSMAAAVSIHTDMCEECRQKVAQMQSKLAQQSFDTQASEPETGDFNFNINGLDMTEIINAITADTSCETAQKDENVFVSVGPVKYRLHRALKSMDVDSAVTLGKISRAKIELNEGPLHTHLLHMAPGGEVSQHTHNGFEVTLLLEGSFVDEMGEYGPGDFIMLDGANIHSPRSPEGCICLTVVSDAIKFTSGFGRLLNPLGKYLY